MSIRSLPIPRIIEPRSRRRSAARPVDGVDDRVRPQCGDDRGQMLNVSDLDIDHDLKKIRRTVGDLQITDIAALLADDRRQAAQIAGLVGNRDVDPADVNPLIIVAPGDVEPAFRRFGEAFERLAVDRVDRYAFSGGHDADDTIARQRMAAAREMQRHAGNETTDRYRRIAALGPAPSPVQRDDLGLGFVLLREGGVDNRAAGGEPLSDRDIEILDRRGIKASEDRLERTLGELSAFLAERLLQNGAPEIEVLRALLSADEAANAGARLSRDDKPLPCRRRRLRLRRN